MEREGNDSLAGDDESLPGAPASSNGEPPILSSTLLLDHVGEVTLTFHSDGLSWKLEDSLENVCPFSLLLTYL